MMLPHFCMRDIFMQLSVILQTFSISFLLIFSSPSFTRVAGDGTTAHMQEIFTGRCWDYLQIVNAEAFKNKPIDCVALWDTFSKAFSNKDPCQVDDDAYDEFFETISQALPEDQTLFWSGVHAFVQEFNDLNNDVELSTLENTLYGSMMDALHWCGKIGSPGINYDTCPSWGTNCSKSAEGAFWKAASKKFASQTTGVANAMLNASRSPAFRPTSVFAEVELPIILESQATEVRVLLVHHYDHEIKEKCDTGSLVELREKVESKGKKFSCELNPVVVRFFLCTIDTDADECMPFASGFEQVNSIYNIISALAISMLVSLLNW